MSDNLFQVLKNITLPLDEWVIKVIHQIEYPGEITMILRSPHSKEFLSGLSLVIMKFPKLKQMHGFNIHSMQRIALARQRFKEEIKVIPALYSTENYVLSNPDLKLRHINLNEWSVKGLSQIENELTTDPEIYGNESLVIPLVTKFPELGIYFDNHFTQILFQRYMTGLDFRTSRNNYHTLMDLTKMNPDKAIGIANGAHAIYIDKLDMSCLDLLEVLYMRNVRFISLINLDSFIDILQQHLAYNRTVQILKSIRISNNYI